MREVVIASSVRTPVGKAYKGTLRATRPDAGRPYKAFGYPLIPALYILGAAAVLAILFVYRTSTTWPGLIIVLVGVPVYFAFKSRSRDNGLMS